MNVLFCMARNHRIGISDISYISMIRVVVIQSLIKDAMGENNILVELIVLKKKRFEMHFIFGLTNYIV